MGLIYGLVLASVFPLVFLWGIRKLDFYQTGRFRTVLLCLTYGAVIYAPAAFTNWSLANSGLVNAGTIDRFIAPFLEEILKALVLIYLVRQPEFTYSVDGAVYGFATGIGFAIFENFEYITDSSTAITDALQRVFSANLIHASSSAILGIALGMFYLRRTWSRWLILAFGLFLAIGQHIFFNVMVEYTLSPIVALSIGILGAVFIIIAIQLSKKQAQGWIRQKLGMDDRITSGELAMVDRLDSTRDIFLPVLERFGAETTGRVEKLLYLQARLGIKRRALDSFQNDGSMRNALEAEIAKMRTDIDAARREIGLYPMLFVRGLFTEEMVSVWDQMQAKIRERSAANDVQKGAGLWASLEERVKTPTDPERLE